MLTYKSRIIDENVFKILKTGSSKIQIYEAKATLHIFGTKLLDSASQFIRKFQYAPVRFMVTPTKLKSPTNYSRKKGRFIDGPNCSYP